MATQIELAAARLFDKDALNVTNIKMFPGSSRDISAERLATEINQVLSNLAAGNLTEVADEEYCD